jgi:hypothetical protein
VGPVREGEGELMTTRSLIGLPPMFLLLAMLACTRATLYYRSANQPTLENRSVGFDLF